MEFIKDYFKNRTLGFWLAFGGAALALVSSVAYLIVYLATAGDAIDRVFSPLTFAFMLAGSLTALAAERLGFKFGQLVPAALYAVAVAYHWMQSMYPMADAATGVAFLGGNLALELTFGILFAVATIAHAASCFMTREVRAAEKQTA